MTAQQTQPVPLDTLLAHRPFVTALARALAPDAATADDIAQETWTAAVERPPREGGSLRAWFATVVRREARRVWRKDTRRARRETAAAPPADAVAPSAADVAARAELHGRVVQAVLALDEPARGTILLRYFEGLDSAEIARREGVPAATVRKRLERALETLRARLDEDHGGDRRAWTLLLFPGMDDGARAVRTAVRRVSAAVAATALAAAGIAVSLLLPPGGGVVDPEGAAAVPADETEVSSATHPGHAAGGSGSAAPATTARADAQRRAAPPPGAAPSHPLGAAPEVRAPGLVIRVVDEADVPLTAGEIRLRPVVPDDAPEDAKRAIAALPAKVDLAATNPFTAGSLPPSVAGLTLCASVWPVDRPPTGEKTVDLSGTDVAELKIVAPRATRLVVRIVESGTLAPLEGAWFVSFTEAGRRGLDPAALRDNPTEASAVAGENGYAVIPSVAPGVHRVKVTAAGHTPRRVDVRTNGAAVVELRPGAAGTVIARCVQLDGTPSEGDHVSVGEDHGVTGADGTFVLRDIPPGERELFLMEQMIGRAPRGQAGSERVGCWIGERPFVMEPGATIEVGVGFVRGDASLTVEVVDRAGVPQPGLRVTLIDPGTRTSDTSADGVSRFRELPDGRLRFQVEREDGRPTWDWTDPSPLRRGEARRRRVVLADAEVAGTLTADGVAVPGDTVVLLDGVGLYAQRTAPVGGASFVFRDVPAGRWWVRAEATGLVSRPVVVEVGETGGDVAPAAVKLVRGALLTFDPAEVLSARLVVSDTESVPLVAAGRAVAPAWEEPRGAVAGPFAAGTLRLVVAGRDGREREAEVRVADGQTRSVGLPPD